MKQENNTTQIMPTKPKKDYRQILAFNCPGFSIYKNHELEVFCQKVCILRQNWIRVSKQQLLKLSSSPVITSHDLLGLYAGERVKICVHLKEQDTCRCTKNINRAYGNTRLFRDFLKSSEKMLKVEFECLNTIKPIEIIQRSLDLMIQKPEIFDFLKKQTLGDINPAKFSLRFKDVDEYLLKDLPLINYGTFHKLCIDAETIYLELSIIESQVSQKEMPFDFDEDIYRFAVEFINRENDLIKYHSTDIKKKFIYLIGCYNIIKLYDDSKTNLETASHNSSVEKNLEKLCEKLCVGEMDNIKKIQFQKLVGIIFEARSTPETRQEYAKVLVGMMAEASSTYCEFLRNFTTMKFCGFHQVLSSVKFSKEIPRIDILNQFMFEIFKITELYYHAMQCCDSELFSSVPPDMTQKYLDRSQDFIKIDRDKLEICIVSVCNIIDPIFTKFQTFYVQVEMIYCSRNIGLKNQTPKIPRSNLSYTSLMFDSIIALNIPYCQLHREMGLIFSLIGCDGTQETVLYVGYSRLFGKKVQNHHGDSLIGLVPIEYETKLRVFSTNIELNKSCPNYPFIHLCIQPLDEPDEKLKSCSQNDQEDQRNAQTLDETKRVLLIEKLMPIIIMRNFNYLSEYHSQIIWADRDYFKSMDYEHSLIPLIVSAGVISYASDSELTNFLQSLPSIPEEDYFLMLGPTYSHSIVRKFVIDKISSLPTEMFSNYANVMANCFMFEPNLWSSYMCLMIQRSWDDPHVAHKLFWACKQLSGYPFSSNNFILFMSVIMTSISREYQLNLTTQLSLVRHLSQCGKDVQAATDAVSKTNILKSTILKINEESQSVYNLPISQSSIVTGIDDKNFKIFSSASSPLLINFLNKHECGFDIAVIFKVGDILTRDMITINIFKILVKVWLKAGLDMKMRIYDVLPTDQDKGFLEVVPGVTTMGEIHARFGLTGTFNNYCIVDWLKSCNPSKKEYERAILNFTLSCAGYCVATYILGICDRHNDNILLLKTGHILHIDFNKYMGDSQMFLGFKRDRAPFVLTPDMLAVINELNNLDVTGLQYFVEKCCLAYKIARKNATTIFNTLNLMLFDDPSFDGCLKYVYDQLKLDENDNNAHLEFHKLIIKSANTTFTQINFFIHNLAQKRIGRTLDDSTKGRRGLFEFCASSTVYNMDTDGKIIELVCVDHVNRKVSNRPFTTYLIFRIVREDKTKQFIYRTAADFKALMTRLKSVDKLTDISITSKTGTCNSRNCIKKKDIDNIISSINKILHAIMKSSAAQSVVLYTWCHPFLDDDTLTSSQVNLSTTDTTDIQTPRMKLIFDVENDTFSVLVTNIQNLKTLSVPNDAEIKLGVVTLPSGFIAANKKIIYNPDNLILKKFEIPMKTVIDLDDSIFINIKVYRLFGKKIIGYVEIPIKDIDYTRIEGSWYIIKPSISM
ncbi:Phosphatidylinositol 4-phosphate 3-kinase C2 domain-containing subunit alpha [Thelohanellus kitauei]|uniref:Phosphatidylinositol 4-phosphate 3-kinase C2 domain-containing subunit alpha n=1 Tax=Thelohanellus kitauei TaxID=669202 RepID=A0A0C2MCG5_THEKT|nr:Phosphatidylinositol 4-phosphate 3-kinase C2 domain-containing subunit alpha [Thelohanellus kitauei]